jgi:hypothetical protein
LTVLLAGAFVVPPPCAAAGTDIFAVASDGHGTVSLIWYPAPERLTNPAFRLFETKNGVEHAVADRIVPGDAAYAGTISARDFAFAAGLAEGFRQARGRGRVARAAAVVAIKALSDFRFAQAAGFARVLRPEGAGTRRYRVVQLDESGAPTAISISSPPVDPAVASPAVTVPQGLRARVGRDGVELGWSAPLAASSNVVLAYRVERSGTDITPNPVVVGSSWKTATQFVDAGVARNADATYRVVAIDVLGRRSAPSAPVTVYALDVAALEPPKLAVRRQGAATMLTWAAHTSRSVAGYVVQRGTMPFGAYDTLTPSGLSATTTQYTDATTVAGTTYFYRIAAMSPRGDLGPPSAPAMLAVARGTVPNPPSELRAVGGATRVRLTWRDPPAPIAGIDIERRNADGAWIRLTQLPVVGGRYDDAIGQGAGQTIAYRATALGRDGQRSSPSTVATATMVDGRAPGQAVLIEARPANGTVHLGFRGPKDGPKFTFWIYRSTDARSVGAPIVKDVPQTATSYDDRSVTAGSLAVYRVRAVSANGPMGDLSDAKSVVAGGAAIPAPPAPAASFAASPFKHVNLRFAKPPHGMYVVVYALDEQKRARRVAWNVSDDHAVDARPLSGSNTYSLAYVDAAGRRGVTSPSVTVQTP